MTLQELTEDRELMDALSAEIGKQMEKRQKKEQADKVRNYRVLNAHARKKQILFTGSSLMEMFPIAEIAQSAGIGKVIYNRGIGGTTTDDFLREIDTVLLDLDPAKVFLNIGTNDMTDRIYGAGWKAHLFQNYEKILQTAREKIPEAEIYCMAYYPTNHHISDDPGAKAMLKERTRENIEACSQGVAALAEKYGYHYIDCNEGLVDENGEQKREFAIDGVHMYADAYEIVFENLKPYL